MFANMFEFVRPLVGVGFIGLLGYLTAKEWKLQNNIERSLKRRVVRAYYHGKREGQNEWLQKYL